MNVYSTTSIHATADDLDARALSTGDRVVLYVGTAYRDEGCLNLFLGPKAETLAALARWTELVQALPDDEVPA